MASKRATKIDAVLRHLAAGDDISSFPGTRYENLALVRTAVRRGLITWDAEGNRYTLTPAGWSELTPRRFGIRSLVASTAVGAAIGAAALAFLWLPGLKWQGSAQATAATAAPAVEKPVVAMAPPPADIGGRSVAPMTATSPPASAASTTAPVSASTPAAATEPAPAAAAPAPEPPAVQTPPVKHATVRKRHRKPVRQARPTERSNPYGNHYANPWSTSYPRYGQGSWNSYRYQ